MTTTNTQGAEERRAEFEIWLAPTWSRATVPDAEGDIIYVDDWVQGAWVGFCEFRGKALAHQPDEATHLRELAAYRLTVENLEREIAAITSETGNPASAQGAAITSESETQPAPDEIINMAREQGLPETETEGVFIVNADDLGRIFASYRAARAPADSATAPAEAKNTKTHELLSTTVGLLMGYREGAARQPYKPGSLIAKVVYEVVDHLKDWPYLEPIPPAQAADSVLEDALSDSVRTPLDSLHADAAYLIGRLREGSMPYARVIEIIRERIDAAKAAIRASAAHGQAPAPEDSVQEDAARYRWLAAHCRSTSEHWGGRWSIIIDGPAPKSHDSEDDFDAAIDAARKQGGV